jgi:hypothetical protein
VGGHLAFAGGEFGFDGFATLCGNSPERLSCHVIFADTALHDAGKKVVMDFIAV